MFNPLTLKETMMAEVDIRTKIGRGDYNSKVPYPSSVPKPVVLRKRVNELTEQEIRDLPLIKIEYDAAVKAHRKEAEVHHKDQARLNEQFRLDVFAENKVDPDTPFGALLWSKAWEHGHANGLSEVVYWFEDFMDFYHEAQNMVRRATTPAKK